ncbi:hypothetical protein BpHYR1_023721 [Brachionus plicatilis]|uniref:Uncharacterized protein n=1 Tax=Brachionus plicatilis TaxID=10195 RepID=A0A3M7RTL9_BRAPC|nr:hypothetical protein BpHYR1_023721 [Brachionus plicatilis]
MTENILLASHNGSEQRQRKIQIFIKYRFIKPLALVKLSMKASSVFNGINMNSLSLANFDIRRLIDLIKYLFNSCLSALIIKFIKLAAPRFCQIIVEIFLKHIPYNGTIKLHNVIPQPIQIQKFKSIILMET